MVLQVLGRLEVVGQLLADGLFDHPATGEADHGVRLGQGQIAEHGEARRYAAGGRVGEQDDVGQARLAHPLYGDDRPRHLHKAQDSFLHTRTAAGRDDQQGGIEAQGFVGGPDQPLADRAAHRPAHEGKVEGRDHDRAAAHLAAGDNDGVFLARAGLVLAQARGVGLLVLELQRVGGQLGHIQPLVAGVEQAVQPLFHRHGVVMPAVGADVQVLFKRLQEQHLVAGAALGPEVVGRVFSLTDEALDTGTDVIG